MFDFGDKVENVVTGYSGKIVSYAVYCNGCVRYKVVRGLLKDKSEYDQIWLDEGQLKIKESSKTTSNNTPTKKTGGPANAK